MNFQDEINKYKAELPLLQKKLVEVETQIDRKIEDLQTQAGIAEEITQLTDQIENARKQLQSRADFIQGSLDILNNLAAEEKEEVGRTARENLIPEGVTHKHGIELASLTHTETLMRVLSGETDTVSSLGGQLEPDVLLQGEPEDEDEDEVAEDEVAEDGVAEDEVAEDEVAEDDIGLLFQI